MNNLENKCLNWLRNQCHENDEFYQIILKNYGLKDLLNNFEFPFQNEIQQILSKNICYSCKKYKIITNINFFYLHDKILFFVFCPSCGLKIRLAYLYSLIINFIKENYFDDKDFATEVFKIFATLKLEAINMNNFINYHQNFTIWNERIFINFLLNTQKYPILERIPCFY